ncbi:RhoGEF GTPase [Phaffia rhodozyma]|uniref:Actin cytoskeleton-regulatory complex protein PAN1 n=1 Tax=Phaffia rhodozyma TaxID=264483 RepID=A0A0F7SIR3_PHARH|nr:RhoGEF GTPase [Phaffia rhodozyma]
MNNQWNPSGFQQPQQTGYQYPQQTGFQPQQTGFSRPPLSNQTSAQPYSFLNAPPPSQQGLAPGLVPQATGWAGAGQGAGGIGGGLRPQVTGWAGAGQVGGGLMPQATGWAGAGGLVPQQTGFHDPRLQMMSSSFMPMNISTPYASSGAPVFQQPNLPASTLSSSMNMLTQNKSIATPKIPWTLTKDERKNYDQIFRAWDQQGTGFISGETAQEVFGQSGLNRDDMAQIWTLADADNRGKLNIQEFHVAMALIYRRLNGNDIPNVLPPELVPASSKDLDSNVDFLKNLLKNDTNYRSTSTDDFSGTPSYSKSRSFNSSPNPSAGASRKDGTVYKHDENRDTKVYKSSARHLDRASVRTGNESASDDLSEIKRQLQSTSSLLDKKIADEDDKTAEDEALEQEMEDLKYRVRRVKDDIEYVSSGRRTAEKDEERRKLERELLYIAHEKIPEVEKRIAERDERKKREDRDGIKARDRRNDRYGGRYEEDRYGRDRDEGYLRGTFDQDDRDRYRDRDYQSSSRDDHRDRERYHDDRDRNRRPRSPPPAPAAPSHSLSAPHPPAPPPSAPVSALAPTNLTPEQRKEQRRLQAEQKIQERMRALGLATGDDKEPSVDKSVEERLEREKKEAEEKAKEAEASRAEKEKERKARLEAEKGGPAPTTPAPVSVPDASKPKAAPPPPQPRSILKKAPTAPASKPQTPVTPAPKAQVPPPPKAPVPVEDDVDDQEDQLLREREQRLKNAAATRAARMAELERQEEEERKAEEEFEARKKAGSAKKAVSPASGPVAPVSDVAEAAGTGTGGSHNPFHRLTGGTVTSPTDSITPPVSVPKTSSFNPFFKKDASPAPIESTSPAPPPVIKSSAATVAAPIARPPAKQFITPPDEDWDVIEDKDNDSDSSDDYDTAKKRKAELARALFGGIMPPTSSSASPVPRSADSPVASTETQPSRSNSLLSALGGGSADPASRGGLFASIQGGAKLKKTVTKDTSSAAVTGRVIGDAAPPAHISDVPRAVSPPVPQEERVEEVRERNANRESVDWYQGLAANGGVQQHASELPKLAAPVEEDEEVEEEGSKVVVDPLDGVNLSRSLKVRTLFSYEGQRPEDLSFTENLMIDAHPATDPESPWMYGTTLKERKSGWFPASYVSEVLEVVQAKALYTYTGTTDEELPFIEGDTITIVDRSDESWWKAVIDGVCFLVPASYLELIATDASFALPEHTSATLVLSEDADIPTTIISPPNSELYEQVKPLNRRSVPTPPPPLDRRPSSSPRVVSPATAEDDHGSEDDDETEENGEEEARNREIERLRVVEMAGLIIKPHDPNDPLSKPRRPAPSVPTSRKLKSSDLGQEGTRKRSISVTSTTSSLAAPSIISRSPSPGTEIFDAYDKYQAFLEQQAQRPSSISIDKRDSFSLPDTSGPITPPQSTPLAGAPSLVTSSTFGARADKRLSQFMNKFASVTSSSGSGFLEAHAPKKISVGSISSPASSMSRTSTQAPCNMFEFIATESAYVRDCQLIVGVFYAALMSILDDKELLVIFANIEDILMMSTTMHSELEESQRESRMYLTSIADILINHIPNVDVYVPYCVNQSTAASILQSLRRKNLKLEEILQSLRTNEPALRGLDLSSFLLIPMQRITRYPLLLKQILHYTEPGEDYTKLETTIYQAEKILMRINENIRLKEGNDRLAALSADLWVGNGRLDLSAPTRFLGPRKLLKEGTLTKGKGSKKLFTVILTNDLILVLSEPAKTLYQMPIPLQDVLVSEEASSSNKFEIIPRYRGNRLVLRASSSKEAIEWVSEIEEARSACVQAAMR